MEYCCKQLEINKVFFGRYEKEGFDDVWSLGDIEHSDGTREFDGTLCMRGYDGNAIHNIGITNCPFCGTKF